MVVYKTYLLQRYLQFYPKGQFLLYNVHVLLGGGGGGGGAGLFTFGRAVVEMGSLDTRRSSLKPNTEIDFILLNGFDRFLLLFNLRF